MNRIQLIFNEKWAMAREDYYNLVSLILPSIHSGNFKEVEAFFEKDTVTAYASDLNFVGRWNLEDSGLPSDSVAVIVLEGTLYSWETFRLQEYIAQAAANDRIAGIILWINGPGGNDYRSGQCVKNDIRMSQTRSRLHCRSLCFRTFLAGISRRQALSWLVDVRGG